MGKSRRQDTRSEKSDRDTIRILKAENRQLHKQIAQLRKELGKRQNVESDLKDLLDEKQASEFQELPPPVKAKCPKCQKDVTSIEVGKHTILVCSDRNICKWRTRKK